MKGGAGERERGKREGVRFHVPVKKMDVHLYEHKYTHTHTHTHTHTNTHRGYSYSTNIVSLTTHFGNDYLN